MSDTIIVALISLGGIIISALITKSSVMNELDKKLAILEVKQEEMSKDIKSHNGYAKMFAENIPVIKEQIKNIDHRVDELERGLIHEKRLS